MLTETPWLIAVLALTAALAVSAFRIHRRGRKRIGIALAVASLIPAALLVTALYVRFWMLRNASGINFVSPWH